MSVIVLGSYVHAHCLTVSTLPLNGASIQAQDYWHGHGGKGLNLAIGMHRLGLEVCLLLAIGQDRAGKEIYSFLEAEGVNTKHVLALGEQSGFGVGLISADGQNIIAVHPGANHLLVEKHVTGLEEDIKQSSLICAQFEIQQSVILTAFRLAKRYHLTTLLNPSPWKRPSPELLALTDLLIMNESEAACMFELEDYGRLSIQAWCDLSLEPYWQGELLIITLAERGAVLFQPEQAPLYVPAWGVKQADPPGAGDAFTAGFAYALLTYKQYPQAMQFANACGALLAQAVGVLDALPQLSTVETFMQQNRLPHSA